MAFSVYILTSKRRTLYIGITRHLKVRIGQHRSGELSGFAHKYNCHILVYYENCRYVQNAIRREKQLKGWTRKKKIELIESVNRSGGTSAKIGRSMRYDEAVNAEVLRLRARTSLRSG